MRRERRNRDRLVDPVDAVDDGGIDNEKPVDLGEDIDAAGEGTLPPEMSADEMLGQSVRGFVLADIAWLQSGGDHTIDACGVKRGPVASVDHMTLFERGRSPTRRPCAAMAPSASDRGYRAKFQDAGLSLRNGFLRKAAIISPAIETAISAGLTAPISSPIGA